MTPSYEEFLAVKSQLGGMSGFEPLWLPDFLFDFQKSLVEWSIRKGRGAIFADCGLGKTIIQLVWAENVVRKTNRPVLILTPLAVSHQTVAEAAKFGIEARRSLAGEAGNGIIVTNYERLHYFDPNDFAGCVCDESSILKSFEGERRQQITEFMRKLPYRLLCTATAAPNDYIELGTSSEALGQLGYTDMLTKFFKNDQNTIKPMRGHQGKPSQVFQEGAKWRFKGHAEIPFWRWVCSWARAARSPSDLGFSNEGFVLPPLVERDHLVEVNRPLSGELFPRPAIGLREQRDERRLTIKERCERAAELVEGHKQSLLWCHLNVEGDLLTDIVDGAQQISGSDPDEAKEERFMAFVSGQLKRLVTKPKIGAYGLNLQNCNHMTSFPSHSYEQYYQGVRRCWRFGQKHQVNVDLITTEGERAVLKNLQRKSKAADKMFSELVAYMNDAQSVARSVNFNTQEIAPAWL